MEPRVYNRCTGENKKAPEEPRVLPCYEHTASPGLKYIFAIFSTHTSLLLFAGQRRIERQPLHVVFYLLCDISNLAQMINIMLYDTGEQFAKVIGSSRHILLQNRILLFAKKTKQL
jgi:hypothetical protein